jgi:hypothetical protein
VLQNGVSLLRLCTWCLGVAAHGASPGTAGSAISGRGQEFESAVSSSAGGTGHVDDVLDGATSNPRSRAASDEAVHDDELAAVGAFTKVEVPGVQLRGGRSDGVSLRLEPGEEFIALPAEMPPDLVGGAEQAQ